MLNKSGMYEVEGVIQTVLPDARFMVEIEGGHCICAYLSGKMRMNFIKIVPGDIVKLEIDPSDVSKGRVVYRRKKGEAE